MAKVVLKRVKGDYGFDTVNENGTVIKLDTNAEMGGTEYGARPMQVLLNALAGCASIDVISILKKQRQEITDYTVTVTGEREPGVEPSLWKHIEMVFEISGKVDEGKARRAVEISMNKYCSVAVTLTKAGAAIDTKVIIHNA
ncbi:osmotically inducible protein OsmC [Niabella ginsenosidivorans]|uniref:Osmotically inducible protein OsmC n=1 Tax=Niabella ginsenosidivorans TaxID=1176587 RepID=A0A1A9I0Q3_9BACT|nr:OsmC family protein [Niabella ginsenosidivorans]ANH81237.1 osmotically inducible protein OsmC [Niabella ginsenosidivorans]